MFTLGVHACTQLIRFTSDAYPTIYIDPTFCVKATYRVKRMNYIIIYTCFDEAQHWR